MRIQGIPSDTFRVLAPEDSTHASAEAGCDVAQIARSMLFRVADGRPVVVVASGANRVDEKKAASLPAQKIIRADAAFVRLHTGAAPGGVPPVGHPTAPITLLDRDLQRYPTIWAAGGSPNARQFSFW